MTISANLLKAQECSGVILRGEDIFSTSITADELTLNNQILMQADTSLIFQSFIDSSGIEKAGTEIYNDSLSSNEVITNSVSSNDVTTNTLTGVSPNASLKIISGLNNVNPSAIEIKKNRITGVTNTGTQDSLILDGSNIILGDNPLFLKDLICKDIDASSVKLNALEVSNGSSTNATTGNVLTASAGSMIWSAPPSPALIFYQFKATGNTSNFNNNAVEDLNFPSMALDVSSSSSGNAITYIPNTGTFSFLTPGVYHISIFIGLKAPNSYALRLQARLLKNGTLLTYASIYDSDSNIHERDITITIIQNMAVNDTLTLQGYGFGNSSSLQWFGTNQTRMSVIKLS